MNFYANYEGVKVTPMNVWYVYENEKWKIQQLNLTPNEYANAIEALCDRLGI